MTPILRSNYSRWSAVPDGQVDNCPLGVGVNMRGKVVAAIRGPLEWVLDPRQPNRGDAVIEVGDEVKVNNQTGRRAIVVRITTNQLGTVLHWLGTGGCFSASELTLERKAVT